MDCDYSAQMRKILDFLLEDSKWSLEYIPTSVGTNGWQDIETLKSQINSLLSGDDISQMDFNRIYRHIALENRISAGAHRKAKDFLAAIRFYGFHQKKLNSEESKWLTVKEKLVELLAVAPTKCAFEIGDDDINLKGDAIRSLRKLGYEIPLVNGCFWPTKEDEVKFGEAMRYRFDKIGTNSIWMILNNIRRLYRDDTGRYDFRPEPTSIGTPQIVPPWGYLLNVALSFIMQKKELKQECLEKIFKEIMDLSNKYFTVLELQNLSKFTNVFRSYKEIVDEIEEEILYNQHVALDQYPLEDILEIIKDLEYARGATQNNPIVDVLEWICRQKRNQKPGTLRFTRGDVAKGVSGSLSACQLDEVLDSLTIEDCNLNHGYYIPSEVCMRNYYKYPLVLSDGFYVLFDTNFCAKGFYLVWLNKFGKGIDLGTLFEAVVQKLLLARNIIFLAGQKYKITSEERKSVGITSEEAECDFVIETSEKIYFIEMKKKEITGSAMAGDAVAALNDMSKSALAAFVQAAKHEVFLRKRGEIRFKGGNKITLGGKRIEKIHISAFDHYGLHDKMLIERLLKSLVMCTFNYEEESKLLPLKEMQEEFKAIATSDIIKKAYDNGSYLMTFHSFSLPQFMFVLRGCKSGADFGRHLDMTSHITTGMKDWYNEQAFMSMVCKS